MSRNMLAAYATAHQRSLKVHLDVSLMPARASSGCAARWRSRALADVRRRRLDACRGRPGDGPRCRRPGHARARDLRRRCLRKRAPPQAPLHGDGDSAPAVEMMPLMLRSGAAAWALAALLPVATTAIALGIRALVP